MNKPPFFRKKCKKITYVHRERYLLNPYLLTVLLSIPFCKLPCTMASFSRILVVSVSVTHQRLWIPRSWRHYFLSLWQPTCFVSVWFLVSSVSCMINLKISLLTINSLSLSHCTPRELSWKKRRECTGPFHIMYTLIENFKINLNLLNTLNSCVMAKNITSRIQVWCDNLIFLHKISFTTTKPQKV